ncbi:MAG: MBOAT family protein [Chitinophagia bacterium]|nr:MBOAT family protein [Chitinophagia bacterium]
MLFNSFVFLGLLTVTFLLYYLPVLQKYQIQVLILSSLVFYGYEKPALVLLLLASVSINILASYFVTYGDERYRKLSAVLGVVLNLSILVFFKYSPLLARTFDLTSGSLGDFLLHIPLPIGISFFTFQGVSLVVDVYTEKYCKNTDVVPASFVEHSKRVLFFKGFFPQLISGPIVKAHDFLPQIRTKRFGEIGWESAFKSLVTGYFLKMVVADNLKDYTFLIEYPFFQFHATLNLLIMMFGYSCQIFADFAGYSLIAIGLAKLFGYDFKDNFDFPYISRSFREFWKRWHISLSSFLMEYLYIPLGGNRKGRIRTYVNLMVVMMLGGLWHGAAWSYAVWGGFHGLALALERMLDRGRPESKGVAVKALKTLMVFSFVTLAWLLFKLPEFGHVIAYLKSIAGNVRLEANNTLISFILLYSSPVILYHLLYLRKRRGASPLIQRMEYALYGMMLFLIIVNSGTPGDFIYFQF